MTTLMPFSLGVVVTFNAVTRDQAAPALVLLTAVRQREQRLSFISNEQMD